MSVGYKVREAFIADLYTNIIGTDTRATIVNPSFETPDGQPSLSGWETLGAGAPSVSSVSGTAGSWAARVTNTLTGAGYWRPDDAVVPRVAVTSGGVWSLGAWLRRDAGTANINLTVQYFDAAMTALSADVHPVAVTGTWAEFQIQSVVPVGAAFAEPRIQLSSQIGNSVDVDMVQFVQGLQFGMVPWNGALSGEELVEFSVQYDFGSNSARRVFCGGATSTYTYPIRGARKHRQETGTFDLVIHMPEYVGSPELSESLSYQLFEVVDGLVADNPHRLSSGVAGLQYITVKGVESDYVGIDSGRMSLTRVTIGWEAHLE